MRAHFLKHATTASSGSRAMAAVPDGGACKVRYQNLIRIARLFAASGHGYKYAWQPIAICRRLAAPAPLW